MKYLSNKKGFLGVDNKSKKNEKVVVVPFGIEKTVSYGSGTSRGPQEIIKASHQVDLFDEDLNKEPHKVIGIKTLRPFPIKKKMIDALKQIENINNTLLNKKKFPLVLGGEHSLTPGAIRPFVKKFKKICLLHFDAHADLRNSYNGNKFSHASAIRRCLDNPKVNVISFGIRNISSSEMPFLKKNKMGHLDNINFIVKGNYNNKESKKLLVDFAIHNNDWSLARENVQGLIQFNPDREICEFMASMEMGEFNDIQKRDAWILRAENANLDEY